MFAELMMGIRGLSMLTFFGQRTKQKEIQLQQMEKNEELQEVRLQFQELMEQEKRIFQADQGELQRSHQEKIEQARQLFQKNEASEQRNHQSTLQELQHAFQAIQQDKSREAQKEHLATQLTAQRNLQLDLKKLDAELSRELKRFDRETAINSIREQKRLQNSPLVSIAEDLLQNPIDKTILHVFFAPPTVKFDKNNVESSLKLVNENELANGIRELLESFHSADRETVFHGGGWQTRAIHSEAAIRSIYRELRSEPSIIVETFAEGNNYHIHFAFWAEQWPDFRYKRVFSFNWRKVLAGYAKETTQKYEALHLSDEDFKDFYGEHTFKAYRQNLALIEKEGKARKINLPEKDIQRNIVSKYVATPEDTEKLTQYITLHHNIGVGLLMDEYHLLHAGMNNSKAPLLPDLLPDLLTDISDEEKQALYQAVLNTYQSMYACLEEDRQESESLHIHLLQLAEIYMKLAHEDEAKSAIQKSAWYFFVLRHAPLPKLPEAALLLFTQEACYPYVLEEDAHYLGQLTDLINHINLKLPKPMITHDEVIHYRKQEEEQKKRQEEARKQSEKEKQRKIQEEAKRKKQEEEQKKRQEEARRQAEKEKQEEEARLKPQNGASKTVYIGGVALELVYVEGGTFQMGATSEQGYDARDNEKPVHTVTLDGYWIGKYAVTQKQWKAVMGSNPSYHKNCDDCPVEEVSWNDIQDFLREIGGNYALPTEAQWEYAARGGRKRLGYKYSGSSSMGSVAWHKGNSVGETHRIGEKEGNELCIYDMSGNVFEWCSDWFDEDYYSNSPQTNPKGPSYGENRSVRGGSWDYGADGTRVSFRGYGYPTGAHYSFGFRVVLP